MVNQPQEKTQRFDSQELVRFVQLLKLVVDRILFVLRGEPAHSHWVVPLKIPSLALQEMGAGPQNSFLQLLVA
jgi:hypothetical protein